VASDVLDDPPAPLDDRAVGESRAKTREVVAHSAVRERRRPFRRARDETADGPARASRLEREDLAALRENAVERRERAARLDRDGEISGLVLEDAPERLGREDGVRLGLEARGGEARSAPRGKDAPPRLPGP